jgi:hypothetical protein
LRKKVVDFLTQNHPAMCSRVRENVDDEMINNPPANRGKEEKMKVHVTWTNNNRPDDEMIDPALAEVDPPPRRGERKNHE